MLPHQQRVIDEKNELDIKAKALGDFIGLNPTFATLSNDEKDRLKRQSEIMNEYSKVLGERIAAFTK